MTTDVGTDRHLTSPSEVPLVALASIRTRFQSLSAVVSVSSPPPSVGQEARCPGGRAQRGEPRLGQLSDAGPCQAPEGWEGRDTHTLTHTHTHTHTGSHTI